MILLFDYVKSFYSMTSFHMLLYHSLTQGLPQTLQEMQLLTAPNW